LLVGVALAALLVVFGSLQATPASAAEPKPDVGAGALRSSLFCQESATRASRTPVLLVTGTGVDGSEAWPRGIQSSLVRDGIPSCYVNFPQHTTADIQVSVQYLVNAIRVVRQRAGRDIAIYGISQGGLLPRFALTYWPSLRSMVSDVVLLAGTQHGTSVFEALGGLCAPPCRLPAATWQQAAGSNLLDALNRPGRDETPGSLSWTTVRTLDDDVVQPTSGPNPTSALAGASNLVIQKICPGRKTSHIGSGVDSVSYAALRDAMANPGPAKAARISPTVCRRPYAPGLDPARTAAGIEEAYALAAPRTLQGTDGGVLLLAEPSVRRYVRSR